MPPTSTAAEESTSLPIPPPQDGAVTVPSRQKKRKLGILIAVVGLVLAGSAGAVLLLRRGSLSSEEVIQRMLARLAALELTAAHYEIEVTGRSEPREPDVVPFAADLFSPGGAGTAGQDATIGVAEPTEGPPGSSPDRVRAFFQGLPKELDAAVRFTGTAESGAGKEAENDAEFTVAGNLALGGLRFAAGGELRKVGPTYYLQITEAPSLGLFDLAALKGQWVRFTAEEFRKLTNVRTEANEELRQQRATFLPHIQIFFRVLAAEDLLTVAKEFPREETADGRPYHYALAIDWEKLPRFCQRLAEEAVRALGDDALFTCDGETLASLRDPAQQARLTAFNRNATYELWVDAETFLPRKVVSTVRLAAPEDIERLRGTQFRSTSTVSLSNVNEPVTVTAPPTSISLEEAQALLVGGAARGIPVPGGGAAPLPAVPPLP